MDPIPKADDEFWTYAKRPNRLRAVEQEFYPDGDPPYMAAANVAFASLADQKTQLERIYVYQGAEKQYDLETMINDMYAETTHIAQLYSDLLAALFEETQSVDERLELTSGLIASIDSSHWDILTKLYGYEPTAFWNEKQGLSELEEAYNSKTTSQFCEEVRKQIDTKMTAMIDELGEVVIFEEDDEDSSESEE